MANKEIIREKILDILNNRYEVNIGKRDNVCDLNLLGRIITIDSSNLNCFFLDIEKQFDIIISQEDIVKGRFKTINTIAELIYEKYA